MRRLILVCCLTTTSLSAFSQDWQCIQPAAVSYFNGPFLRAIRIDSIKASGNDLVYYPFRSLRISYDIPNFNPVAVDSNGGSWIGKTIRITPDGSTWFDTHWGDTVLIKTKATQGESWYFLTDPSSRHYIATVTAVDTMTVLNTPDSVKKITITTLQNGSPNPTDICHNKTIILSKNHGLVRTFALHTFPYRPPGTSTFTLGADYNMEKRDVIQGSVAFYDRIDFTPPTAALIYDFAAGDLFEYASEDNGSFTWTADTIVSRTLNGNTLSYQINRGVRSFVPFQTGYAYNFSSPVLSMNGNSYPFMAPGDIPEERYNINSYSYYPDKAGNCGEAEFVVSNDFYLTPEPCYHRDGFKPGYGKTYQYDCSDPSNAFDWEEEQIYSLRNGLPCGQFEPIINSISNIAFASNLLVYPIPADDRLNMSATSPFTYQLTDLSGRVILSGSGIAEATVDVSGLADGLYLIRIGSKESMGQVTRKLLIRH